MRLFFPGSFDPFTIGHENIVQRAISMGNTVVIGIGNNSKKLSPYLSLEDRLEGISEYFSYTKAVEVKPYSGLTIDAAREYNCDAILRGIRNTTDFEYEKTIDKINQSIGSGFNTVFLMCSPEMEHVSSSMVKEISKYRDAKRFIISPLHKFF